MSPRDDAPSSIPPAPTAASRSPATEPHPQTPAVGATPTHPALADLRLPRGWDWLPKQFAAPEAQVWWPRRRLAAVIGPADPMPGVNCMSLTAMAFRFQLFETDADGALGRKVGSYAEVHQFLAAFEAARKEAA